MAPTDDRDEAPEGGVDPAEAEVHRTLGRSPGSTGVRLDLGRAATLAVGIAGGLLLATAVELTIERLRGLFIVIVISIFLSFAMEPAVQYLNRRGVRRGMGTAVVFAAALLGTIGFVAAMAPLVIDQVGNLVESGPEFVEELSARAQRLPGGLGEQVATWLENAEASLPEQVPSVLGRVGGSLAGIGSAFVAALIQSLTVLLLTFYLVADGPRLRRTLVARLEPEQQYDVLAVWELAIARTGGYVYSRVLLAVVSGLFHYVVFRVIDLPQAAALALWVGIIASLVPVVGTYLAGALPILIALAIDPGDAIVVLAAVVVYQQVENYLVAPRVTAHAMELHPALAFLSVLVGGALLGAPGALLALPAAAVVTGVIGAFGERHEPVAHDLLLEIDPDAEKRMLAQQRRRARVSDLTTEVRDQAREVKDDVRRVADDVKRVARKTRRDRPEDD